MKLKTLKDIECDCDDIYDHTTEKCDYSSVDCQNLKQEAIKHLQFMESKPCTACECCDFACQKDWIKHFFNISEEELK